MAVSVLAPPTPAVSMSLSPMVPYVPSPTRLTPPLFVSSEVWRMDRRLTSMIRSHPSGTGENIMRQIVVLGLALVLLGCGKKEPLHKGKPASYWREALNGQDPKERREAIVAMGGLKVK